MTHPGLTLSRLTPSSALRMNKSSLTVLEEREGTNKELEMSMFGCPPFYGLRNCKFDTWNTKNRDGEIKIAPVNICYYAILGGGSWLVEQLSMNSVMVRWKYPSAITPQWDSVIKLVAKVRWGNSLIFSATNFHENLGFYSRVYYIFTHIFLPHQRHKQTLGTELQCALLAVLGRAA